MRYSSYKRCERVNVLIKEEISDIILHHVKDPRIGFTTITDVNVTPDLRHATIYVSFYNTDKEQGLQGLKNAAGFIRSELGKRIKMKYTPKIEFKIDTSIEYGAHITEIIDMLNIPKDDK
jgi:ribosome-binding factor A